MFKTIDLFAGAGGLSYGFEATGKFKIVAAAEINKDAATTYIANHQGSNDVLMIPDVRKCDFKGLADKYDGIDVVIGGPPCQGFSNANRQKNHIVSMNNSLVKEYFRAIREIKPKAFVMENVSMLASDTHRFYDSKKDHEEVVALGIEMREDTLVIASENYNGVNCYDALSQNHYDKYSISEDLLHLLDVLYKDRNSKENRVIKFITKYGKIIRNKIIEYFSNTQHYNYQILHDVFELIQSTENLNFWDDLHGFIQFQKSFRLLKELDENDIIYHLSNEKENGKIIAKVNSYAVIDYVNKILGDSYAKNSGVLDALWFGVPQDRKRFIMIGVRKDIMKENQIKMPDGTGEAPEKVTVGQAIMDLVSYQPQQKIYDEPIRYMDSDEVSEYAKLMRSNSCGIHNHIIPATRERAMQRFMALREGQNFHKLDSSLKANYADPDRTQNSIYLRLDRSKPSGTVINVRKSMWVHPTENRAISVREAARLQSFPDMFVFKGSKNSQYQQVGNAVPPLMAEGIAKILLKYI